MEAKEVTDSTEGTAMTTVLPSAEKPLADTGWHRTAMEALLSSSPLIISIMLREAGWSD